MRISEQGKAIVGAVLAGLVAGSGAMVTGLNATGGEVTAEVVWGAVASLFAAIATVWTAVFFTTNAPSPPTQVPVFTGTEEHDDLYDTRTTGVVWDRGETSAAG